MKLLLLNGFNVYSNRKIKYYSDEEGYETGANDSRKYNNIDFNPNDGVLTTQIIDTDGEEFNPDYLVALDENENIVSRWFVMEWTRTRNGQYRARLKRDVVADHYDEITVAPMFMHRGPLSPTNPLVFNPEGMSLNQIKKEEILLKDETESAWIVGYVARDYADEQIISSISADDTTPSITSLGVELNDPTNPLLGGKFQVLKNEEAHVGVIVNSISVNRPNWQYHLYSSPFRESPFFLPTQSGEYLYSYIEMNVAQHNAIWDSIVQEHKDDILPSLKGLINQRYSGKIKTLDELNALMTFDGKKVTYANKYYQMKVILVPIQTNDYIALSDVSYPALTAELRALGVELRNRVGATSSVVGSPYSAYVQIMTYSIAFEEISSSPYVSTKISNSRRHLSDAPYDMFCMKFNMDNLSLSQQIALKMTRSNIYDLQILPYCPILNLESATVLNADYSLIVDGDGEEVDRMYYPRKSSGTFFIDVSLQIKNRFDNATLNIKLSNECDIYRLCSPNYNSAYEFSVAKNGGVDGFRIDFTYRPISPYIHVAPIFKNLYGGDFEDARGLICGGDFSIDMISSAWENYQVNNKNFQNIFNTQIKSMDIQHKYGMMESGIGAISGAIGAGAGVGLLTGNVGLGIGAGAVSLGAGIADQFIASSKYKETKDISIEQFNYSLGNIKAIPNTLSKISAYNINNKYFPFIEYYSCTDEEIVIYKNKIDFNSYILMKIGTINDLINDGLLIYKNNDGNTFVKGEIIRINLIEDDHMQNEIYNELLKGVYL